MLADLVYERCEWSETTKLLDFGCGHHGNIAAALCQFTEQAVAVDSSAEAVQAFNQWCGLQGLGKDEVCAVSLDSFQRKSQYLDYFDTVVASLVFHHIDAADRSSTAAMIRERMRPGAAFILLDVLRKEHSSDAINGFTQNEVHDFLEKAGFANVDVELGPRITLHSQKRTRIIIAKAYR